ncbi:hypothetical protein K431DRAFT_307555 [Polychaeton citri CBS 116435]|uniref:Uncharacterized protein n=1 Tax=Polychaeton citri CBS 116435 TaxID=1314669 RepID=A0A9P4UKE4_9PEZI|nr:hypothetical protein K431DRAFT_307555 [Polychaeton citri CBS 116435]
MSNIHSTGRGGAGNIGEDTATYVDGDIIREGTPQPGGSTGRGGAGNIAPSPRLSPAPGSGNVSASNSPSLGPVHQTEDVVPESATRQPGEEYGNFHTGRGGAGNEHRERYGGHSHSHEKKGEGLLEKAKHAIGLDKHKKHEPVEGSGLKNEST